MILPVSAAMRSRLQDLHRRLLQLHKALLDDERKAYEKINGPVPSAGLVLNLVMYDPFFDWLHRISEGIVKIDELTEDQEATAEDASDLIAALRVVFKTGETESEFMKRYKAVLQREPGAVLAHFEVQKLLLPDA